MFKTLWSMAIASTFLLTANLMADQHSPEDLGYQWQNIPVVCAPEQQVVNDLKSRGLTAVNMSLGRANSDPNGEPVFMVTYWLNADLSGSAATLTIPTSPITCILYHTHDMVVVQP